MLQNVIKELDQEEAAYHIKRCVDSGMWVPEGGKGGAGDGVEEEGDEEVVYETVEETPSSESKTSINDVD